MESSGLLSILVLSILLVNVRGHGLTDWFFHKRCPRIQDNCEFKERDECSKDKKCPRHEKCCFFSCGRKCLNLQQVSLQTYAVCPENLAPAWLFSVVGGMIRQIIPAPASSMAAAKETITTSNPKPYARAPAPQKDCSALKLSKLPREPEKTQSREVETPTLEVGSYQCTLDIIQP
ncbi:WAP four-disulfide core domain protein 6-like [Eschrichtius robustus]|uniref:WAP four-disulfide core domain protein 6-like n=1 Tax=Eschrichtius robustus TaxID=9764 RepID=UPI0035C17E24